MSSPYAFTPSQVEAFHRDGYVVVEGLLAPQEIDLLGKIARADHHLQKSANSRADGEGGAIRLVVENSVTDDIYGAIVRSRKIVDPMEQLLNDEV